MTEHCENCRFMRAAERFTFRTQSFTLVHECRHHAPDNNGWPEVRPSDWCAEWEALTEPGPAGIV